VSSFDTDVLIVGSGPAGASAALFLATLGVRHTVITKYRWTVNTPRAHIANQRTVEIFRDLGIEADILAQATGHHLMGDTVFCTSLAGDELGRVRTWETHPERAADYLLASPSRAVGRGARRRVHRRPASGRVASGLLSRAGAGGCGRGRARR
jgi:2,4-dichlorophenol 6-monooxygenase